MIICFEQDVQVLVCVVSVLHLVTGADEELSGERRKEGWCVWFWKKKWKVAGECTIIWKLVYDVFSFSLPGGAGPSTAPSPAFIFVASNRNAPLSLRPSCFSLAFLECFVVLIFLNTSSPKEEVQKQDTEKMKQSNLIQTKTVFSWGWPASSWVVKVLGLSEGNMWNVLKGKSVLKRCLEQFETEDT